MRNDRLISLAIAVIIGASLMSYFVRPKPPSLELVRPQDELSSYQPRYPGDPNLANRVIKSYELAFILVQSPFSANNVQALEGVRQWARDNFQLHPDFLHPVSLPNTDDNHDTVFGALGYNLFATARYWTEERIGQLLRLQIDRFHQTGAYKSFNAAYFDFFGKDADSATLLARYESDRARSAVDVIVWALVWFSAAVAAAFALVRDVRTDFFNTLRLVTAGAWTLLSVDYLSQSWASGHAAPLISMIVAAAIALFLFRPFFSVSHKEARQQLVRIHLAPCWIATMAWFTFSCLAIQVLTWMRTGSPGSPDPVSLMLSSLTGDFLHDHVHGKRLITSVIVGAWLVVSVWALRQRQKKQPYTPEPDSHFETLNKPVSFDRVGNV